MWKFVGNEIGFKCEKCGGVTRLLGFGNRIEARVYLEKLGFDLADEECAVCVAESRIAGRRERWLREWLSFVERGVVFSRCHSVEGITRRLRERRERQSRAA